MPSVFRVDPSPVQTVAGNFAEGGDPAIYAVGGATIELFSDFACTITATAYTDATGNTACPVYAPVTLPGSSLPSSVAGPQGQFGFWLAAGTYYYKITAPSGVAVSGLPMSAGGSGAASTPTLPFVVTTDYAFGTAGSLAPNSIHPESLTAGIINQITLPTVPPGVNGTDTNHWLYISDGANSEALKIVGGTAVAGGHAQTLLLSAPLHNHAAGAYALLSSSAGIQEAWIASNLGTVTAAEIRIPAGSWPIYAPINMPSNASALYGAGILSTTLYAQFGVGDVLAITGGGYPFQLGGFSMSNTYPATVTRTSGAYIRMKQAGVFAIQDVLMSNAYIGVELDGCNSPYLRNVNVSGFTLYGFYQLAKSGDVAVSGGVFRDNSAGGGASGSQAWRVEAQAGGAFAGFTNLGASLQGADYLIAYTGDGIINETTWAGMILDSAQAGNIILSGTTGSSATKHKFTTFLYGGNGAGYLLSVNSKYSDIIVSDFNGGCPINGADISIAGAVNVTISNGHMTGMDGQAQKVAIALAQDPVYGTNPGNIRINNLKIGYGPGGQDTGYRFRNAIQVGDGTVNDLFIYSNQLNADTNAIVMTAALTGAVQIERNSGVDNVRPTIASANVFTLGNGQFNPIMFVSGNTVINTITGPGAGVPMWNGKMLTLIFTHASPLGVSAAGNIAVAVVPTQFRALQLVYDAAAGKLFPLM